MFFLNFKDFKSKEKTELEYCKTGFYSFLFILKYKNVII